MDNKLKNSFEEVHAPASLFQDTLNKMYEANEALQNEEKQAENLPDENAPDVIEFKKENPADKNNTKKQKKRWIYFAAGIAACLCAGIIALVVINGGSTIYFNSSNLITRSDMTVRGEEMEISEELFNESVSPCTDTFKNIEGFEDVSCYSDSSAGTLRAEYSFYRDNFYYSLTQQATAPYELSYLDSPKESKVSGVDVIFVESTDTEALWGFWKLDGSYYVLKQHGNDKDSFIKMAEDLIAAAKIN